jgi:hypothetical protein
LKHIFSIIFLNNSDFKIGAWLFKTVFVITIKFLDKNFQGIMTSICPFDCLPHFVKLWNTRNNSTDTNEIDDCGNVFLLIAMGVFSSFRRHNSFKDKFT